MQACLCNWIAGGHNGVSALCTLQVLSWQPNVPCKLALQACSATEYVVTSWFDAVEYHIPVCRSCKGRAYGPRLLSFLLRCFYSAIKHAFGTRDCNKRFPLHLLQNCISLLAVLLLLSHEHDVLDGTQTHVVLAALQDYNSNGFLVRVKQSYCHNLHHSPSYLTHCLP